MYAEKAFWCRRSGMLWRNRQYILVVRGVLVAICPSLMKPQRIATGHAIAFVVDARERLASMRPQRIAADHSPHVSADSVGCLVWKREGCEG